MVSATGYILKQAKSELKLKESKNPKLSELFFSYIISVFGSITAVLILRFSKVIDTNIAILIILVSICSFSTIPLLFKFFHHYRVFLQVLAVLKKKILIRKKYTPCLKGILKDNYDENFFINKFEFFGLLTTLGDRYQYQLDCIHLYYVKDIDDKRSWEHYFDTNAKRDKDLLNKYPTRYAKRKPTQRVIIIDKAYSKNLKNRDKIISFINHMQNYDIFDLKYLIKELSPDEINKGQDFGIFDDELLVMPVFIKSGTKNILAGAQLSTDPDSINDFKVFYITDWGNACSYEEIMKEIS